MLTIDVLTANEQVELHQLEERITGAFYEIGQALSQIRDRRLYRANYPNFEAYCGDRWKLTSRRVNQFIAAAEVVENLGTNGSQNLPASERQCRPLAPLEPEQQREAWVNALSQSPNPTAAQVQSAVNRVSQRAAIAPGSKIKVVGKKHTGAELQVQKTENSGAMVYCKLPSGESYPFLAYEVEVVEAAPAPAPKPKPDYKQQAQAFKDLLSRCLPYLPADLMQEVEEAISD